jgi:ferritin-like metal-binding protein YciE
MKKSNNNTGSSLPGAQAKENDGSPLEKYFQNQLMDIYYVEKQLVSALQEMKEAATTEELEDAFDDHRKQTERHVKRLEKVFDMLDLPAAAKACKAIEGLIEEAKLVISETKKGSMTRDAALIIAAQKVEHYEIASYGGLVQLAITMGKSKAAELLDKTLREEGDTDHRLTQIAETYINLEADNESAIPAASMAMA